MDWFRMYQEFASDPKVQSMPEAMQRRLVMLLCLRCSNALVTLQDDEIAFALRISEEELAATKALFQRKGFIDEGWEILNWDKRQFVSDSSAERVARHRAKKKEEAQQACNVTVTPPEQNRTETEQNKETPPAPQSVARAAPGGFEKFWAAYPRKVSKGDAERAFKKLKPDADLLETILKAVEAQKGGEAWCKDGGQYIPHPATWLNGKRWDDEVVPYKPVNPKQSAGSWWLTEETKLAKAREVGVGPALPGESAQSWEGRIRAAIDNGGKPPAARASPAVTISSGPTKVEVTVDKSPEAAAARSAALKAALRKEAA